MLVNQVSGGHAHGYLGALKGLSPELVESVNLINGPFNAQYGEFSGLGVVNIKTRQEMADQITLRAQYGQFNTRRVFAAYSPTFESGKTSLLVANEYSYSDGPFERPLDYLRNNVTLALFRRPKAGVSYGVRMMGALNDFYSAGQLPIDQVEQGRLNRFGFVDPTDGGYSQQGTVAGYFTKETANGQVFQVNGMVQRLLFDLFSNFTFFAVNPVDGDGFGQHDSRLQQALNLSWIKPHQLLGGVGNFSAGGNVLTNQINLTLYNRIGRVPTDLTTAANTTIGNVSPWMQETLTLAQGKVQVSGGLRYDQFFYRVTDRLTGGLTGGRSRNNGGLWQPKASFAYTPWLGKPLTIHWNYGRSVTSTNARALGIDPESPLIAKTDLYQFGTSHNKGRYSLATSFFWIDRSLETIYEADSGVTAFTGPSRSYGYEAKTSVQLTPFVALNASVTKVINAFYRDTNPRLYIDRAPHFTGYVGLTMTQWKGWSGSLRLRAINRYILNGEEEVPVPVFVPGHTVTDFGMARRLTSWLELNLAVDNLFDKQYFETFERYTSALRGETPFERVHGTPGYGRTVVGGLTFRLFNKAR
jgi:outer membrane receptor protein involved in Fe transport